MTEAKVGSDGAIVNSLIGFCDHIVYKGLNKRKSLFAEFCAVALPEVDFPVVIVVPLINGSEWNEPEQVVGDIEGVGNPCGTEYIIFECRCLL